MTLMPKLKGSPPKIRKTTKKWLKMGQFAWRKFSLFKFGMMWQSLMDWHWFLSCRVALRENRGKILNFEKSAKMEQKMYFFENFKKYSLKDQVKSYSEKVLTLWFSLEMYLKNIFEEDPLCENSTCHKNKAVSNISSLASFLGLENNPRM